MQALTIELFKDNLISNSANAQLIQFWLAIVQLISLVAMSWENNIIYEE